MGSTRSTPRTKSSGNRRVDEGMIRLCRCPSLLFLSPCFSPFPFSVSRFHLSRGGVHFSSVTVTVGRYHTAIVGRVDKTTRENRRDTNVTRPTNGQEKKTKEKKGRWNRGDEKTVGRVGLELSQWIATSVRPFLKADKIPSQKRKQIKEKEGQMTRKKQDTRGTEEGIAEPILRGIDRRNHLVWC